MNPPDGIRIGTVGKVVPGVEIKLADDGELLVRGPLVMRGYRNEPEQTAEAIDADGWLHTGDVATIDADGYVTIVDRKKELIINAAGKNMSPANIEGAIKAACPLIGEVVAIGDARPYNTALLDARPRRRARRTPPRPASPTRRRRRSPRTPTVAAIVAAGHRRGQREAVAGRADQAVRDPADRLGARRRRADADDEAQAQADRREVRRRDRRPLRSPLMAAEPVRPHDLVPDPTAGDESASFIRATQKAERAEEMALMRRKLDGVVAFMAGPANVAMQLGWPEVGYGVVESRVTSGRADSIPSSGSAPRSAT